MKNGLELLETYVVPGYVFYMEFEKNGGKSLTPILSPALKDRPELLRSLKKDVPALTSFVKYLSRDSRLVLSPVSGSPLCGNAKFMNPGIFLLGGFKRGFLEFERGAGDEPVIRAKEAFTATFPDHEELIRRFLESVNGFGDEREPEPEKDHLLFMENAKPETYDRENAEFTFTFLGEPEEDRNQKLREEAVRENAFLALEKTNELLKRMAE